MNRCRSCNAPIEWAFSEHGNRSPLDLGLWPDGRLAVVGKLATGTPVVHALPGDTLERLRSADVKLELRRSHFQTCPDADEWRR